MTGEEAAKEIKKTIKQLNVYLPPDDEWVVALTLAVQALGAQSNNKTYMIDKMQMPTVPAQWDGRDCFTMWEKIQELVEKVNELGRRIGGNDETD